MALLDAQLGALDSRVGGPLTFAEHPRPYLVLSGAPPPPPEAASVSSGSSAAGGAAGGDGEHLVGQVWVSGPLGRTPSDAPQRATLVVYKRQQVWESTGGQQAVNRHSKPNIWEENKKIRKGGPNPTVHDIGVPHGARITAVMQTHPVIFDIESRRSTQ